ncbi:MAG: choice-of-anchor J domain-containing protein [Bacteroidales bacterium]|nr:choice-of-anchor J domain-containing protein [Bacteroidales bacterium]
MKTLTTTLILTVCFIFLATSSVLSQNQVANGDLESWSGGLPDGWQKAENITQESTQVHGGNYSARHASAETTQDMAQDITGIQEGNEYTISYWYYDNDPQARTRIWSYWLSGTATLPDHADELRPNTYSEDNAAWQQFSVTLNAPATADGFRFEVRVYKQDNLFGGFVYYDDFVLSGDIIVNPEPSHYPEDFEANANGLSVELSWTDSDGPDLPDAYIIMAGISPSLPVPQDGTPVANDPDLSDGQGALNVSFGVEEAVFSNLEGNTAYYFTIYPYSNGGANIDFKNDGTAPAANATTSNFVVIETENFDVSWGSWTPISVTGAQIWDRDNNYGPDGSPCARVSGYEGQSNENEDWLISPAMNFENYDNEILNFQNAKNYSGPDLKLKISTDYDGGGDPNSATWTDLTFTMSGGTWQWQYSGDIDLSGFSGTEVYVAFYYTSNTSESATWEVDDIVVTGEGQYIPDPEPSNYPTDFTAAAAGSSINLSWTDAVGTQLPDAYILFVKTDDNLPVPVDGTPVPNDTDLSDGEGALNVSYGIEQAAFSGLVPGTTYYFSVYPYTNSGVYIDFKTDGTAPTANATASSAVLVTIEAENFNDSWGGWQAISVTGAQVWDRDNTYGPDFSPCARMSGYEGQSNENSDWLISPAMNFNNYNNEYIVFQNASNYTGPDLELKVSSDYDGGGDPTSATWTTLSYTLSGGNWQWTGSGEVALSAYNGAAVYVAFHYTSTTASSATWEVDDIEIMGEEDFVIVPEPDNYPTNFAADASGSSIFLSWTDATGTQLPHSYLIMAGIQGNLPVPVDGAPVANDTDLSDGNGALNIAYGMEETSFGNLDPSTTYYFTIYSYTNSGSSIDYKNDGIAPAANATTGNTVAVIIESENFNDNWGNWQAISVTGAQVWDRDNTYGPDFSACARMSGYEGQSNENSDWLVSPAMNFDNYDNEYIVFQNAKNYSGPDMQLKVSTDYDGGGNPTSATWTTVSYAMSGGSWQWTNSGEVDLSGFNGTAVYVAFHYTSTSSSSATWEVDDIEIKGEEETTVYPEPSEYPTGFMANAAGTSIQLSWTDAGGAQAPGGYIVIGSLSAFIPVPVDGAPIPNDPDLSDGLGAINVTQGTGHTTFSNLVSNTTYYFVIYSYTNSGAFINYKTDETAPTSNATTANTITEDILTENFDAGWGGWTPVSVTGTQAWDRNNSFGPDGSPCAKMSGWDGSQSNQNEDWLISPAIDMTDYFNGKLNFMSAKNFSGADIQIKGSENYDDGGDPSTATWINFSASLSSGGFTWTESGTVDISGLSGATVYIAFIYTSTSSQSATWEIDDVAITAETEAGTPEYALFNISMYPNPATERLFISNPDHRKADLTLLDMNGREWIKTGVSAAITTLDTQNLPRGMYIVRLYDEKTGEQFTRKLIIR